MNPETVPTELLEELRDAHAHAGELQAQATSLIEQGKVLIQHASMRIARKMGLTPKDSIDLSTGAITRAEPDEVRP